jgi:sigma-B regulation protein RsbU (phosphoserine phosphatase)
MVPWRRSALVLVTAGIAIAGTEEAWLLLRVGGTQLTAAVDGAATLGAAAVAASCSGARAARSVDRVARMGWWLMSGAMAAFVAGVLVSMLYVVVEGQSYPFPSLADVVYLTSAVLEVAAMLFLGGRALTSSRVQPLLDGGIVATSLFAVSWVTTMAAIYGAGGANALATAVALAYPVANVVQLVIVLSAAAHTRWLDQGLLLVGLGTISFAVTATIFARQGNTHPSAVDVGEVIGCFLVALGAVTARENGGPGMLAGSASWRLALPYVPVLLVAGVMLAEVQRHGRLDMLSVALVAILAVLVVVRQLTAVVESQSLAGRLARTSAEHQLLIEQAPVGICRLDAGGRILSANLALEAMLGYPALSLFGRALADLVEIDDHGRGVDSLTGALATRFERLAVQARAVRFDGSAIWCSAIVGPLRADDGQVDRSVAIIEDITERKRQADMAAHVQRQLLPQRPLDVAGYRLAGACLPADNVAGDFYDWELGPDGSLRVTVADVMGKGMGAALVMAVLRTALRTAPPALGPAARVGLAAEAIGLGISGDGIFATLFHAQLDVASGRLRYVDAGHGYCAIRRAAGELAALDHRSLPVGVRENEVFEEGAVRLAPGDALLIYSDGLVERPDRTVALSELTAPLQRPCSASTLLEQLLDRMPPGATDDVTAVVLERLAG